MVYLYITLVVMLFAAILWGIVCFHYVLQQQRNLNLFWGQVGHLLMERNELTGSLQELWLAPGQPPLDARMLALQELMAQDATMNWQDVPARANLRQTIETETQHVLASAAQHPVVSKDTRYPQIREAIAANGMQLGKSTKDYNRTVQLYNNLLQINPNRFIAQKLGFEPAPYYVAQ